MRPGPLYRLYVNICRKAYGIEPFHAHLRWCKSRTDLANVRVRASDVVEIHIHERLKWSGRLVGAAIMHEVAHLVSGEQAHNDRFYRAFFKAARTKFGRRYV